MEVNQPLKSYSATIGTRIARKVPDFTVLGAKTTQNIEEIMRNEFRIDKKKCNTCNNT